jgi:hypothetical protein
MTNDIYQMRRTQAHQLDVVVKKANNNGISCYETNKMPSHSTFSHIPTTTIQQEASMASTFYVLTQK